MKCEFCKEKVDIEDRSIPPTWYGRYKIAELTAVTCAECLPDNVEKWRSLEIKSKK
jgi:hypothetical protein